MPTSRPGRAAALATALAAGLAACVPGARGLPAITVSRDVTVVGPAGYCVDGGTARERSGGSFVALGSCAALRGGGAEGPAAPAVLTALVSPPGPAGGGTDLQALERFVDSEAGRAALAHDGRPESVEVLATDPSGGALYIRLRDASTDRPAGLSDDTWRAILPLGDRLVVLSAMSHSAAPVDAGGLRATLERFVTAMRAANGNTAAAGADEL